jgi:2-haloacid dehalogenase
MSDSQITPGSGPMSIDRRGFLAASVGVLLSGRTVAASEARARAPKPIKAVLFDAFALFDPRVAMTIAERLYPEKAASLVQVWRTRQFEYQWLHVLGGRYVDFLKATEDGLRFAAQQILPSIRDLGVSLGILSNMTPEALESGLTRANLRSEFSHVLSADRVRAPKPAPAAYRLGVDSLSLERDEVLFVAFAGWDVAGAAWFGYPTYWLNRLAAVPEELGIVPQGTGGDLRSLLSFLQAQLA